MKEHIQQLFQRVQEEGGIGVHGTTLSNSRNIEKTGIEIKYCYSRVCFVTQNPQDMSQVNSWINSPEHETSFDRTIKIARDRAKEGELKHKLLRFKRRGSDVPALVVFKSPNGTPQEAFPRETGVDEDIPKENIFGTILISRKGSVISTRRKAVVDIGKLLYEKLVKGSSEPQSPAQEKM